MFSTRYFVALFCLIAYAADPIFSQSGAKSTPPPPSLAEARTFMDKTEKHLLELTTESQQAAWVQSNFITDDTEALAAQANRRTIDGIVQLVKQARRFEGMQMPEELARKYKLLKLSLTAATPSNAAESTELTRIMASLEGSYGKGKYNPPGASHSLTLEDITKIMATSRNPAELLDVWKGWHAIAPPMRKDFRRYVELANKGARELGFKDTGAMWRAKYDMSPESFAQECDRLWEQVKPLYLSLHAYVRQKLREKYGPGIVPAAGPIPAHLLGNMWAQEWTNIYPMVAPANADPGYDLNQILKDRNTDPLKMVKYGEAFFMSLGFDPLPPTFWDRSLFVKPRDREVVCHASAWDIDSVDDLRIKMCIDITEEDFYTIHHELGHNYYQRAYNNQSFLFRDSANDGFHEAIGDTIARSITPDYLIKIGLLDKAPDPSKDIGLLLKGALDRIAFLPFGLLIDQWRWKVFSGEVSPEKYNEIWWQLRLKYQGIAPGVERTETDFDPGAKYHVPANVPYTRYFLAAILQYQFHRALTQSAGCTGPLHRCSIYGNKAAGERLRKMLAMGLSRPWPDALEALTGRRQMDASAILDYYAPLKKWLDEQNQGKPVGW
jgi:peptidyl-dipeptidase A